MSLATPMPWDLVSDAYDAEVAPMLSHFAHDALRLAAPPPGARVVDVATGPGTLAVVAAAAGHPVDAIDFSPKMIDRLRARQLPGVTAVVGDGQALPYADATFGAGFSMFGLIFFPDRARGFAELARVLVPGARAVVSSWFPLPVDHPFTAAFDTLRAMTPNLPPPRELPMQTEDACRAEMAVAFRDVAVHRATHTQLYPSADELWDSLVRTLAPIAMVRQQLAADAWRRLDDAMRAAVVRQVGSGPGQLALDAWLTVGTR